MILRLALIVGLAIAVTACGTKSELITPAGKPTPHGQKDPSQPNQPIGK